MCDREIDKDVEYIRYLACVLDCPIFLFFYSILTPEIALYITLPFSLLSGVRAYITPVFWGIALPSAHPCHLAIPAIHHEKNIEFICKVLTLLRLVFVTRDVRV